MFKEVSVHDLQLNPFNAFDKDWMALAAGSCTSAFAASYTTAEEFKAAMTAAFPHYAGDNYLEMTSGYLFQ